ncbi:MAG: pyrimidine/purine nucleoside phosphorylase [Desulfobulbaceae bacterium]|nr:MAG: pyrimidine/purine nucleoside phosphorylase [Desulfobulbaceae bacterium]
MPVFEHVTVRKAANIYFDGKVTSRTITFADGTTKTLGIMQPGEYTFSTESAELMEILSGALTVRIGSAEPWREVKAGESFEVPANSSFAVRVTALTDYCCSFLR